MTKHIIDLNEQNINPDTGKLTKQQAKVLLDNFAFGNLFGETEEKSFIETLLPLINLVVLILILVFNIVLILKK